MGADIALYMLALMLGLILLGVHIAVALSVVSFVGVYLILGNLTAALSILSVTTYDAVRKLEFAVIPLFVLMGDFIARCGAAGDLYRLCNRLMRRVPGRLAVATVAGNAVFAAVTGVSIAAAAAFSRISYPEMRKLGYDRTYAVGVIAGSACLGMLIPPSVLMIVWAILTEQSVGALFLAGVVPGIILASMFAAYCIYKAVRDPSIAPPGNVDSDASLTPAERRSETIGGVGIFLLIGLVLGGMWGGLFTPTEAAGFGVIGAVLVAFAKGMSGKAAMEAIYHAAKTTAPLMILLIAASMYSRLLALSGSVNVIQGGLLGFSSNDFLLLLIMAAIWFVLGMLIDSVSIILLTVPIFAPLAAKIGIDPIAFAVFGILVIEAGLLTPPFGLLVYAVKGCVPDSAVTLGEIFRGSTPYWIMLLVLGALVLLFPGLASWLPRVMN